MARIPAENELRKLYINKKQSLSEIATKLNFSVHKITYWMSSYQIPRRKQSEANYIKANPDGEPFCIKKKLTRDEVKLKYLALGLYWGEGGKTVKHNVTVVNSDVYVVRQFRNYLIEICQVRENKIKYYLQTFKDNDIEKAKIYWSKHLSIDPKLIHTAKPIHSMGKGNYKKISNFGVMNISFFNMHLKEYIMKEIGKWCLMR